MSKIHTEECFEGALFKFNGTIEKINIKYIDSLRLGR